MDIIVKCADRGRRIGTFVRLGKRQDIEIEIHACYHKDIYDHIKELKAQLKEERKLGIDVMLALEDCIEHFDDSNWPDDCGYSKADLEKAVKKYETRSKE